MPVETASAGSAQRRVRLDVSGPSAWPARMRRVAPGLLCVLASLLVLATATGRELGAEEAKLGLAAGASVAPLGQMYGGWMPSLLPGRVLPSQAYVWVFCEGYLPNAESVLWPEALALVAMVWIVCHRVRALAGGVSAVLSALALFGSLALIDHAAQFYPTVFAMAARLVGLGALGGPDSVGFDPMTGLWVVAALDRVLGRGSDWKAGLWASLAVFSGGWPALLVVLLPMLVLGRRGSYLSVPLLLPPFLTFLGWTAWTIGSGVPGAVWGEAVVGPLKDPTVWAFAPLVLTAGLPWAPFAVLTAWPGVRQRFEEKTTRFVFGWLQVSGVCALAGTLVPGLAPAAWMPALVGLCVASATGISAVVHGRAGAGARWTLLLGSLAVGLVWSVVEIAGGTYLTEAASYYRSVTAPLAALGIVTAAFSVVGTFERRTAWAVGVLMATSVGLSAAYGGFLVPEWNYRVGQGMAGRAVGQWVPPRSTIFTTHYWPTDLMFATEHPVRQLVSPRMVQYEQDDDMPTYVLLTESEFENWPEKAPKIQKVHAFSEGPGQVRVLVRTEGDLTARPRAQLTRDDQE